MSRIADLRAAGNILAVDASYPGAAAQAANISRYGLASRLIGPAATSAGGAIGSVFGPGGAAAGAFAGRAMGESMAGRVAESKALKNVQKRMTKLSDMPR
jgi:hypothetical protein